MTTKCPICNNQPVAAYKPFCSRRCADVDLGRWLNGDYAIPAESVSTDEIADDGLDQTKH